MTARSRVSTDIIASEFSTIKKMKDLVLSLLAGWMIGIILSWVKIPLPAPPLVGLIGLAGMTLGGWFFQLLSKYFAH